MQIEAIENCKTAKLYDIGRIQHFGALLVIEVSSGNIIACSDNFTDYMGMDAGHLLDKPWTAFSDADEIRLLVNPDNKVRHRLWQQQINGQLFCASGHSNKVTTILEFEPCLSAPLQDPGSRIGFMHDVAAISEPELAATFLMEQIAAITGFDRVMLYQFLPDWHGVVSAEQLNPGVAGFLGLHFPAGDIPENARQLYTINLQRYIADTAMPTVGIRSTNSSSSLDLTYSQLRAVHPVHITYLENIGARTSFSVSIVGNGTLWGLVCCHHLSPHNLDFAKRLFCEELARMVSLHISGLLALNVEQNRSRIRLELSRIRNSATAGESPVISLGKNLPQLMQAFSADSILLNLHGEHHVHGAIVDCSDKQKLSSWVETKELDEVWHVNTFPKELQEYPALQKVASGLLFIPLGEEGYLLLLRNEQVENQRWAGKPPDEGFCTTEQLTPRASFESWAKETRGTAICWTTVEVETSQEMSRSLNTYLERWQLEKIAMEDSLTGLANRRSFEADLEQALADPFSSETRFAIYMLDLDKFKEVNDTMGHGAGDELLGYVGQRLGLLLRSGDTVARLGGDEFALIQHNVRQSLDVEHVARRILVDIGRPYKLEEGLANIGISIGIALFPQHGNTAEELMTRADAALYEAKRAGRNRWCLWTENMA